MDSGNRARLNPTGGQATGSQAGLRRHLYTLELTQTIPTFSKLDPHPPKYKTPPVVFLVPYCFN